MGVKRTGIFRLLGSIKDRDVLIHELRVALDRMRGIDFERHEGHSSTGLDPLKSLQYEPSGGVYLRRLFEQLDISSADSILDVGCGKGSALKLMHSFPFRRVCGIELSTRLVDIARNNFTRLGYRRIEIIQADALDYQYYADFSVIYLYNPFPCEVMQRFLAHLREVTTQHAGPRLLIYNNPVCHDVVMECGRFVPLARYPDRWGKGILVYRSVA